MCFTHCFLECKEGEVFERNYRSLSLVELEEKFSLYNENVFDNNYYPSLMPRHIYKTRSNLLIGIAWKV